MKLFITREFLRDTKACDIAREVHESRRFGFPLSPAVMVDRFAVAYCDYNVEGATRFAYKNILAWVYLRAHDAKLNTCTYWNRAYYDVYTLTTREMREICILGVTALLRRYYSEKR